MRKRKKWHEDPVVAVDPFLRSSNVFRVNTFSESKSEYIIFLSTHPLDEYNNITINTFKRVLLY